MKAPLDLEAFLNPISPDLPAGPDLRFEQEWDELVDALGDDGSREGSREGENRPPNWERVQQLSIANLQHRSKDLRIAMFLVDASTRADGGEGLAQALLVTREILTAFWDRGLHPAADNGDLDDRASALSWLDEKLALVVSSVTFTTRNDGGRNYSYNDFLDAHRVGSKKKYVKPNGDIDENLKKAFDQAIKSGHISLDLYEEAVKSTSRAHAEATLATFEVAAKEFQLLENEIAAKFRAAAPATSAARGRIREVQQEIHRIVKLKRAEEPGAGPAETPNVDPQPAQSGSVPKTLQLPDPVATLLRDQPTGAWADAEALLSTDEPRAIALMTRLAATELSGRDRFQRKLMLAGICLRRQRDRLAQVLLEELNEQVEKHKLDEWEQPELVGRVWSQLYKIYRKSQPDADRTRDLYKKLSRFDPWLVLTGTED